VETQDCYCIAQSNEQALKLASIIIADARCGQRLRLWARQVDQNRHHCKLQQPDENFAQLQTIWETNRNFRLLRGPLV